MSDEVALSLTPYLKQEREYVPWMSALNNMAYFASQFSTYDTVKGTTKYYSTYKVVPLESLFATWHKVDRWRKNTCTGKCIILLSADKITSSFVMLMCSS